MQKFEIKKRKLNADEIELLNSEIKNDPFTSGYSEEEWADMKNVIVAENGSTLAGFCLCDEIVEGWVEIGLLFVLEKERKNGVGDSLVKVAVADAYARGKNMFIVSRNPDLSKKFESYGFKICKLHKLPLSVIMQQILFSLKPFRIKENIRKLVSGNIKGAPVFGLLRRD